MPPLTKNSSPRNPRTPPPDALSSQKPGRAAGNAFGGRRGIHRRAFFQHSRTFSLAGSVEAAGAALRSGNHSIFYRARGREFPWLHELPRGRSLQSPAFGGYGCDHSARRISDFLYAVSGGDIARDAAGHF